MDNASRHLITRQRHDAPRRTLVVRRVERITPAMVRIAFAGPELDGFISPAPDDHVKLFVPGPDGALHGRHYTPRGFDAASQELLIDFALHGEAEAQGPVTRWAQTAVPGASLVLGGPRGSAIVPDDFDWWLLLGDETALPAIARRVETLPAGSAVTSIVAGTGAAEEQTIVTTAAHRPIWVHRDASTAADPAPLLGALRGFQPPPGDGFVFIAGEAGVVRQLRAQVLETMGETSVWINASGYWKGGGGGCACDAGLAGQ